MSDSFDVLTSDDGGFRWAMNQVPNINITQDR